jgi:(p)ppGpp synthase/HD superfamily hydrolase
VEINTRKNQYTATDSWTAFLRTASARNQLNKFVKTKIRDQLLIKSIDNLNTKLTEAKLPLFKSADCLIRKEYEHREEELEGRLLEMLDKSGYGSFINTFYKTPKKTKKSDYVAAPLQSDVNHEKILIDGHYNFQYIFCPECVNLETQIIAKSSRE